MPTGRGETILVLEDESVVLNINRLMLEKLGYTVIAAKTPDEASKAATAYARFVGYRDCIRGIFFRAYFQLS